MISQIFCELISSWDQQSIYIDGCLVCEVIFVETGFNVTYRVVHSEGGPRSFIIEILLVKKGRAE
jgi:hypothetical protein